MANHGNLGDAMILVGAKQLFQSYGQFYSSLDNDGESNLDNLKKTINGGTIFFSGGAHFGDFYRWEMNIYLKVISLNFNEKNNIVLLPHSIQYKNPQNLKHDQELIAEKAKNMTLMCRELKSLAFSKENFPTIKSHFVPDLAFMIGPLLPNHEPVVDVLCLMRDDSERVTSLNFEEKITQLTKHNITFQLLDWKDFKKVHPYFDVTKPVSREELQSYRVGAANNIISRGRIVITDRLHASIMATLIGRPLIYLDNIYGKTTNVRFATSLFFPSCSDENLEAYRATTTEEAINLVIKLLPKYK